jgi:biopolymer transport protein TolR
MAMASPSRRAHGRRRAPMAEINVTPLVDVMLVLLIIFMVTAPLLVTGVPVNLPDSQAKALEQEDQPVSLSIDANGAIFIDEAQVDETELAEQLAVLGARPEPPQINLRADTALSYGQVMRVMGELNRAGLNRVSMVTTQAEAR